MSNFEFDDAEYRLPTFDTPMPTDPTEVAVIEAAEETVAICAALYGMYALDKAKDRSPDLTATIGEELATVDESLIEDACTKRINLDKKDTDRREVQYALDAIQRTVEKRHAADPQLTSYRASIVGEYRKQLMAILMDSEMDDLYEDDALAFWEDLLEDDPLGVIERAFDEAQISVEQELIAQANLERGLLSN